MPIYFLLGTTQLWLDKNKQEPSLTLNTRNRQNTQENDFVQSKSPSSEKPPFKHSPSQPRVFLHGLKAGQFTHQGEVKNMAECIQYCGHQSNCSAAFMVQNFCFTVQCYSKKSCDTASAVHSEFNPKLSFITHLSLPKERYKGEFLEIIAPFKTCSASSFLTQIK